MIDERNAIKLEWRIYRMVSLSRKRLTIVRIHHYNRRSTILLLIVSLFFSAFAAGQATAADPRSFHVASSQAPARLIIRRNPNLGVNIIG